MKYLSQCLRGIDIYMSIITRVRLPKHFLLAIQS